MHIHISPYNNNIAIEIRTEAQQCIALESLIQLDGTLEEKRFYELFYEAAKKQGEEHARIEGVDEYKEFQILNLLPKITLQKNTRILPEQDVFLQIEGDSLHLHTHAGNIKGCLFGHEELWAYTGEELYKLNVSEATRILSEQCEQHIPSTFTKTYLEENYHNEGRLGRTKLTKNTIVQERHAPIPRLYLREEEQRLLIELRIAYAEKELLAGTTKEIYEYREGTIIHIPRDRKTEEFFIIQFKKNNVRAVRDGYTPNNNPFEWVTEDVQELLSLGFEVYGRKNLLHYKTTTQARITVDTKQNQDWLELRIETTLGEEKIPLSILKELLRKGERYVKLADQSTGVMPEKWVNKLQNTIGLLEVLDETRARVTPVQLRAAEALQEVADTKTTDAFYAEIKKRFEAFTHIQEYPLPNNFSATLRPYQKTGYDWLRFLHNYGFGGILADDMGLGKTIMMLAVLTKYHEENPKEQSIIVVPTSLAHNWQVEQKKFSAQLTSRVHHGPQRSQRAEELTEQLIITTYNTLRNDEHLLLNKTYGYAVLDESHAIKNVYSKITQTVQRIQAKNCIAVTGTPIENNLEELYSQMNFANPGLLGTREYFLQTYATNHDELKTVIKPFILQRTKETVAKDLPEKQIQVQYIELSEEQQALYQATKEYYKEDLLLALKEKNDTKTQQALFTGLLRLRQLANHPKLINQQYPLVGDKLKVLAEQLEELTAEGHKALVFSSFTGILDALEQLIEHKTFLRIDGKTKNRQELVQQFQNGEAEIFLISLKAGGVGLTLTEADYVFIVDPWWNPQAEAQAIDRAHRIGQKRPVFVYKLITKGTVEEKILAMQETKKALAQEIIETEQGIYKELSQADIEFLFE